MVRAARDTPTRRSLASRDGRRPIARREGAGPGRLAMTEPTRTPNQQVVPRPVRPLDERACSVSRRATDRMTELPKAYTPHDVEGAIYERWLAADVFAPDGAGSTADPALPPFTIIQPPPNVTGSLHLGHAQRTAVEDLMIRHARMRGHATLFLPGLDHASIAAQFVLDGILAKEGESRQSLGRERYLERMRAFVATTRDGDARPAAAGRRLGRLEPAPLHDGRRARPRPSGSRSSGSTEADLAYRTEALVNWCPGCRTSVSDLEVDRHARDRHALVGPLPPDRPGDRRARPDDATITVATTRPETILGDTAVAVHPDDPRYARARRAAGPHPVRRARRADHRRRGGRPRVRDGRGEDHPGPRPRRLRRPGLRHGLPAPTILADDATIADDRHAATTGMDRYEARDGDRRRPRGRAATSSRRAPHEMVIGRCQRSNDVIEPRLKTQWFIRTDAARRTRPRGDAARAGRASCPSGSRRPGSTG